MQSAEEAPIVLEQQTGYSGRILRMKVFSPNLKQECILGGWDLEFRHHKTSTSSIYCGKDDSLYGKNDMVDYIYLTDPHR